MVVFKDFCCNKCNNEFALYAIVARRLLSHNKVIKGRCPNCGEILYFEGEDIHLVDDCGGIQYMPYCETFATV